MGFASAVTLQQALVSEIRWNQARNPWIILQIDKEKLSSLNRAMESDKGIRFSDYGRILYSGYGEVPQRVKEEMNQRFGMYS